MPFLSVLLILQPLYLEASPTPHCRKHWPREPPCIFWTSGLKWRASIETHMVENFYTSTMIRKFLENFKKKFLILHTPRLNHLTNTGLWTRCNTSKFFCIQQTFSPVKDNKGAGTYNCVKCHRGTETAGAERGAGQRGEKEVPGQDSRSLRRHDCKEGVENGEVGGSFPEEQRWGAKTQMRGARKTTRGRRPGGGGWSPARGTQGRPEHPHHRPCVQAGHRPCMEGTIHLSPVTQEALRLSWWM